MCTEDRGREELLRQHPFELPTPTGPRRALGELQELSEELRAVPQLCKQQVDLPEFPREHRHDVVRVCAGTFGVRTPATVSGAPDPVGVGTSPGATSLRRPEEGRVAEGAGRAGGRYDVGGDGATGQSLNPRNRYRGSDNWCNYCFKKRSHFNHMGYESLDSYCFWCRSRGVAKSVRPPHRPSSPPWPLWSLGSQCTCTSWVATGSGRREGGRWATYPGLGRHPSRSGVVGVQRECIQYCSVRTLRVPSVPSGGPRGLLKGVVPGPDPQGPVRSGAHLRRYAPPTAQDRDGWSDGGRRGVVGTGHWKGLVRTRDWNGRLEEVTRTRDWHGRLEGGGDDENHRSKPSSSCDQDGVHCGWHSGPRGPPGPSGTPSFLLRL